MRNIASLAPQRYEPGETPSLFHISLLYLPQIEVANPRDKMVRFGALRVGQTVKRTVPIINNSPAPITFHLGVTPSSTLLQDKTVLRLTPTHDLTLHPRGGTAKVDVVFSPKSRIPPFTEEVSWFSFLLMLWKLS